MSSPQISGDQSYAIIVVSTVLNAVSIVAALMAPLLYMLMRHYAPLTINRVSLRLNVAVCIADVLFSAFQIYSNVVGQGEPACSLSVFGYILFCLLSTLFSTCIAVNLHIVYLGKNGRVNARSLYLEPLYGVTSVVLAVVLSLLPLVYHVYGWNEVELSCWYVEDGSAGPVIWEWMTFYAWITLCIVYCFGIVLAVLYKVRRERLLLQATMDPNQPVTNTRRIKRQQELGLLLRRIVLYPVVPIVTQSFNIVATMLLYTQATQPYAVLLLSYIGTSIQGLLNFLAFSMDPSVIKGVGELRQCLRTWYLDHCDDQCGAFQRTQLTVARMLVTVPTSLEAKAEVAVVETSNISNEMVDTTPPENGLTSSYFTRRNFSTPAVGHTPTRRVEFASTINVSAIPNTLTDGEWKWLEDRPSPSPSILPRGVSMDTIEATLLQDSPSPIVESRSTRSSSLGSLVDWYALL
jgi:hypothetical protein